LSTSAGYGRESKKMPYPYIELPCPPLQDALMDNVKRGRRKANNFSSDMGSFLQIASKSERRSRSRTAFVNARMNEF